MKRKQNKAMSSSQSIVYCNILNVYDTQNYESYQQNLASDHRDMYGAFLLIKGEQIFKLKNGEEYTAPEKSLFFVKINELASIINHKDYRHSINYWFIPHGISIPTNAIYLLPHINLEDELKFVTEEIRLIKTNIDNNVQYANLKFTLHVLDWLNMIKKHSSNKNTILIDNIKLYINENINKNITVNKLSEHFGYCEKHIRTLFKTALDLSPKQYIDTLRLEYSTTLLLTTKMTLQEIAENLSYYSANHFTNAFKKKYKMTPTEYRNKMTNIT